MCESHNNLTFLVTYIDLMMKNYEIYQKFTYTRPRTIQIINYLYRGIGATEMKSKDKDQDEGERKWRNWLLQLSSF
ncbi:unnamed protein product [Rhizophagus irregularis]|uniref:Uncharacterized protein n=1 Tax=Rhizophagus irregularis TaxID=588596 RepID=A0A916EKD4_9GLOM|nr:unnamed protein product [Rhizophagus irregularis]